MIILLSLQGCSFFGFGDTQPNTPQEAEQMQDQNTATSSWKDRTYVKGIVKSLKRNTDNGTWSYVIEGVDTTNDKLPSISFEHNAVVANEGDLVHASFNGSKLIDLLILKSANGRQQVVKTSGSTARKGSSSGADTGKRGKSTQVVGVPQEEFVKLR